jgi:hypothetical protein
MAGFTSMDDFINKSSSLGQRYRSDWNKSFLPTTVGVAGEWNCLARGAGNPGADALYNTGTNLTFQPVYDSTTNNTGIPHGGNVSPNYKHLINASAMTAAATVAPCVLMLVDLIGFYRVTSVTTTTSQACTNTLMGFSTITASATDTLTLTSTGSNVNINLLPYTRIQVSTSGVLPTGLAAATDYYVIKLTDTTIKLASSYANAVAGTAVSITSGTGSGTNTLNTLYPRYTNGAGVQAFMWNTNATALGAATPNLSLASYTNSAQATGKVTPGVLPIGKTAAPNGLVLYSGTGSGKYGPFMPLAAGDAGIAKVDNIQISVSYVSGEFSVAMAVPICVLPITTLGVASERDLMNQIPSLPRIYDGANLQWIMYNGAATPVSSAMNGHLDFAWG